MILDDIIVHRREQLRREMDRCPLKDMQFRAEKQLSERKPLSLAEALKKDTLSCICEVKKASPSKGLIRPDFRPVDFAKEYERGLLSIIKVAFFKTVKPRQLAFRFVSLDGRGG